MNDDDIPPLPPLPIGYFDNERRGEWIEGRRPAPKRPRPVAASKPGIWIYHPAFQDPAKVTEEQFVVVWKPLGWKRVPVA